MPSPPEDHPPATSHSGPFQFNLRTLLLFCFVIAVFIGCVCAHNRLLQLWALRLWFVFFQAAILALAIYGRDSVRAFSIGTAASFAWITLLLVLSGDGDFKGYFFDYVPLEFYAPLNLPSVPAVFWEYFQPVLYFLVITVTSSLAGFVTVFLRNYAISSRQGSLH